MKQHKGVVACTRREAGSTPKATKQKRTPTPRKGKQKKAKTARRTTVPSLPQTQQGCRTVPAAKDPYGCKHSGLRDLICMERTDLAFMVKENGWLSNKPCKDCASTERGSSELDTRILDMKILLKKGNRAFGWFCNCGQTGHKMTPDDPDKPKYTCDLVLCPGCFEKRECKRSGSTSGGRTRGTNAV
jgi:hypothetical protein